MTIGDQDHGGIAMTTATHLAGCVHQSLDLALGEVATCNCEVFSAWRAGFGHLFSHDKSLSCKYDWKDNIFFTVSNLLSRKEAEKSFAIFSRKIFGFSRTGSGTRSTHLPGRGGGWESESLRVFNPRQESGNGTREMRTGS